MTSDSEGSDTPLPLGNSPLQSKTLESIASAVEYHAWLTSLAQPHLGDNPLELGSGLGDYATAWLEAGTPKIAVSDIDASRLAELHQRFDGDARVTVSTFDVLNPPAAEHSAFVAFNVLEHIPDHVQALRAAHTLVRPGGKVVIFVPAFQFALGSFDREVGHVRRYTTKSLTNAFVEAGLTVDEAKYVNLPGLPAWFVGMKMLKMTPSDGPMLRVWDHHVVRRARAWESRHRVPFGQSVLAIGTVPSV